MHDRVARDFSEAVYDTDRDRALSAAREAVAAGMRPEDVVFEIVLPAMERTIRTMSEEGGASIAQHFMTAQIAEVVTAEMVARFAAPPGPPGCVVIGTPEGDLHSLGKRIVAGCLRARLIDVVDLGVSVPIERFVDEAVAHHARVIAVSSMMVHTARGECGPLGVRRVLTDRGLRGRIRLVVGGAPYRFDAGLYRDVGADAWSADAVSGSKLIADMLTEVAR